MEQDINFDFYIELRDFALSFRKITKELKSRQKKMLITMHRYLDGDAFGSAMALGLILRKLNIDSTLLCVPFVPEKFQFLIPLSKLNIVEPFDIVGKNAHTDFTEAMQDHFSETIQDYGALSILDCAGRGQVPQEAWSIGRKLPHIINIDHHVGYRLQSNETTVLNLVGNRSSTSEVLFHVMQELEMDLDPEIAVPLYIGIIADTRKNEVSKDAPNYPREAIKTLNSQIKKVEGETQGKIKNIFSLDAWEKHLLKIIMGRIGLVENIVHVKFDHDMVYNAKKATDSLHIQKMPFHEFHIRLRQRLRRFKEEFQVVVIFDQILGKVSLYDLHKQDTFDLAALSRELGDGGGHMNRAGFSYQTAKEKLISTQIIADDLSEDKAMEKMVEVIRIRLSEMVETRTLLK